MDASVVQGSPDAHRKEVASARHSGRTVTAAESAEEKDRDMREKAGCSTDALGRGQKCHDPER